MAEGMLKKYDVEEFLLFVGIARRIWIWRNALIHEGFFAPPNTIVISAASALKDFHQEQEQGTQGPN